MKIFNSIRWRLQIWYGLILVVVLAGFGFTAYQLERGRQLRRIDDELHRRLSALSIALGPLTRGQPPGQGGQDSRRLPPRDQLGFDRPPNDQLPDDRPPDNRPPERNPQPPKDFHLPPAMAHLFDETDTNGFYYKLFWRDGKRFAQSANAPDFKGAYNNERGANRSQQPRTGPPEQQQPQTFEDYREGVIVTPPGETILVGCSIAPELKELRLTAWKLTGVGGVVLLLGLTGGWWIASRAIRPIEDISAIAVKISAGDLSQRINIAETESELGKLAAVLNSTFARLESAFVQQQQFTSDAAHELRTPVSVILTQTQMTLNRERTAPEYRETVESCQRAAKRMRRLIESLLALARLDAGQEQMKRMKFDLANTAQDCVELIRPLADERGVKIHCDLPSLECTGDSERLAQVITNLLTNAIQYNQPDGEVRIAAQSRDGTAILTVVDSGPGIFVEDLPRVFERFYRADKSRSTGSNGLGLSICKAIVEAHGGTIEVASMENVGTTFTVRLPM